MIEYTAETKLDALDLKILTELQENATISNIELAERIGISPSATHNRVKRLNEGGYISKRLTVLNRDKLGFDMISLISVRLQTHHINQIQEFHALIQTLPAVLECYNVTGEFDYVLKVAFRNRHELRQFVLEELTPLPYLATVQTSVVFEEVKFTTALPLN